MVSVIALSVLYAKHTNKHNDQQYNIKAIVKKKRFQSMLNLERQDIHTQIW